MKLIRMTITGVLCLGSAVLAQENPDQLQQRILAQAQNMSAADYAFTRTVRTDILAVGRHQRTVQVETYDPTEPTGSRWKLVSVNGAAPSPKALKRFRRAVRKRSVAGYHHLAKFVGGPARETTDAGGRKVFRFSDLPKGSVMALDHPLPRNATADVVVHNGNVAFAEQVRVTLKPRRVKFLMKLDEVEATSRFANGPDGKPILIEQTAEMSGSGLGLEGTLRAIATYSDHRRVGGKR